METVSDHDSGTTSGADALARRLAALGIREEDLQESFVRSSGPGGQNVNKTSTCVVLVHVPTGIQVRCQSTRHQGQNRELARWMLVERLEERARERAAAERAAAEKLRRQNRRPSRAAKRRNFAEKSRRATRRANRSVSSD